MHLPDPARVQAGFQRRGFVLVDDPLDEETRDALAAVALRLVRSGAVRIDRAEEGKRLSYDVVTGDRIRDDGAPLFAFYTDPRMLAWIRALTGMPSLGPSPHLRSAININCLRTAGQQYPWHRDAVPYTALLFLSAVPLPAGGAFRLRAADGEPVEVQPRAGLLLFMDGTRCEHGVAPLTQDALRLSVPMVYPARAVDRPAGLDEFLYGA